MLRRLPLCAALLLSGCLSIPVDQGQRQRPLEAKAAPRGQLTMTHKEFACFPGRDLTPRDCDKAKRKWEQRYLRKDATPPPKAKPLPSHPAAQPVPAKKATPRVIPDFAE